MESQLDQ